MRDAFDLCWLQPEDRRDAVAAIVRLGRAGPHRRAVGTGVDDAAARTHAGMGLERPFVFVLDHARRGLERFIDIADRLAVDALAAHRRLADVVVDRVGVVRERRLDVRPFDLELPGGLDRAPFGVGDDAEERMAFAHHAHARDALDRGLVELHRHRARDRRTDHAAVRHVRHPHVADVDLLGKDHRRDVVTRDRLADDLVLLVVLRLRLAGRVERIADLLVPFELRVEVLPADQLGIGDLLVRVALGVDDAVGDGELIRRDVQLRRRHVDQHAARLGRCVAHLLAAELDAGRARRATLVHAVAGLAHDHFDGLVGHVELFGDDLADRP